MTKSFILPAVAIATLAALALTRSKTCRSNSGISFNVNADTVCASSKLAIVNDRVTRVATSLRGTQTGAKIAMRWNGRIDELARDDAGPAAVTTGKRSIRVCTQPDASVDALVFVALHELAHIACDEIGHTQKFWAEFRYILDEATRTGAYSGHDPRAVVCGHPLGRAPPRSSLRPTR